MDQDRASTPEVSSVTAQRDEIVVHFTDGHRAIFEPYTHGFGYQVEGLRHFYLWHNDIKVVSYNSRLRRSGPGTDEHMLARAADGYTPERILAYWEAARHHVQTKFDGCGQDTPDYDRWWYPWRVVCGEGYNDLEMLRRGQTQRA